MPVCYLQSLARNKHETIVLTSFQHMVVQPKQYHALSSSSHCALYPVLVLDQIWSDYPVFYLTHQFNIQWITNSGQPDSIKEISFKFWNLIYNNKYLLSNQCIHHLIVFPWLVLPYKVILNRKFLPPCLFRTQLFLRLEKCIRDIVSLYYKSSS